MAEPIRRLLGISGVAQNEHHLAKIVSKYFEWMMFFIALSLPFYWYSYSKHELAVSFEIFMHWFIWGIFVLELLVMLTLVRNKKHYLKTNWLNLFIIIFTFPVLMRYLPFFSIFWLARVLVFFRVIFSWWDRQKAFLQKNHLYYTLIVFASICIIGGALMSLFDEGIKDPFTGIWWAVQTITTVGYGDVVPQSLLGRCFAAVIMFMGVALITILTANFSAYLLEKKEKVFEDKQESESEKISHQLANINARLAKIEKMLSDSKD